MSITTAQIRGARGLLDWSQAELSRRTGISTTSIGNIESGHTQPRESTLAIIRKSFEQDGIEFVEGGVRHQQNLVRIIEGEDCYLKFLDEAYLTLSKTKGEILFSAADERRSTPDVIEKLRLFRKNNIPMRSLLKDGDNYFMGDIKEYRWMDDRLYVEGDVKIIFDEYVAFLMSWKQTKRVVILRDANIAEENRRMFDYIWATSKQPKASVATERY